MDPRPSIPEVHYYRVRLGDNEVRVEGDSPREAVRAARRQLARDMPRLWDVIQSLDDSRFQVSEEARR